jgi:hypothetical protein
LGCHSGGLGWHLLCRDKGDAENTTKHRKISMTKSDLVKAFMVQR